MLTLLIVVGVEASAVVRDSKFCHCQPTNFAWELVVEVEAEAVLVDEE